MDKKQKKIKTYYIEENNSFGKTVWLDCSIEDSGRPQAVRVKAKSLRDMVEKIEGYVKGMDFGYQNSYEGNSCNCCGRRWRVYTVKGTTEVLDDKHVEYVGKFYGGDSRVVDLGDAPKTLKED